MRGRLGSAWEQCLFTANGHTSDFNPAFLDVELMLKLEHNIVCDITLVRVLSFLLWMASTCHARPGAMSQIFIAAKTAHNSDSAVAHKNLCAAHGHVESLFLFSVVIPFKIIAMQLSLHIV